MFQYVLSLFGVKLTVLSYDLYFVLINIRLVAGTICEDAFAFRVMPANCPTFESAC
jgi:hypothetical protein